MTGNAFGKRRFRYGPNCNIGSLKKASRAHDDLFAEVLTQQAELTDAEHGRRPGAITSCGGIGGRASDR